MRFEPFWIDSDQRKKFENFSIFGHFWPLLGSKNRIFDFLGQNCKISLSTISIGLYCGHFALLYAFLGRKTSPCAAMRSNFYQNGPKIEVLGFFRGQKYQKLNFLLADRLKDFIAVLLSYHTHLYLNWRLTAQHLYFFAPPPTQGDL